MDMQHVLLERIVGRLRLQRFRHGNDVQQRRRQRRQREGGRQRRDVCLSELEEIPRNRQHWDVLQHKLAIGSTGQQLRELFATRLEVKSMNEKIKQEAAHAMRLIGILNVNGDAVDVVAAVRQSLRNIAMICDGTEAPEKKESEGPDETA
nr:MAG TPA: hypothetical protein [Caudoviricetes sp.]